MNTRTIVTIIAVSVTFLFTSCSEALFSEGSTAIVSQIRSHSNFENVELQGVYETKIVNGKRFTIEIVGTEHVLDNIHTKVSNKTLEVTMDEINYGDIQVDILITMPTLAEVTKLGVGNTRVEGFYDLKNLELHHDGVASFSVEGSVANLHLRNSGVGNFEGFDLEVKHCVIEQNGVGNTKLSCSESLSGELNGVGNIFYKGDPIVDVEVNGVGRVRNAD